jgi:hypothetical protein
VDANSVIGGIREDTLWNFRALYRRGERNYGGCLMITSIDVLRR